MLQGAEALGLTRLRELGGSWLIGVLLQWAAALKLNCCSVSDNCIEALSRSCNDLQRLDLTCGTGVTDLSIEDFKNCRNLQFVEFESTEVSEEGMDELCEATELLRVPFAGCKPMLMNASLLRQYEQDVAAAKLANPYHGGFIFGWGISKNI
jgi:hypothetical protein